MKGEFMTFIKGNKSFLKIGILIIVGIVLILASSKSTGKESAEKQEMTLDVYKENLENEVADLCRDVEGVGKCRVFITLERGEQNSYKGSMIMETKPPKVLGVTVVCRGADSDTVKSELTKMLTALFDIGANRIAILKLNS